MLVLPHVALSKFTLTHLALANLSFATSAFAHLAVANFASVYVAPGEYDEFYSFFSGGFSGQLTCYGLPSGRLLKIIPVFAVDGENG